MEDHYPSIDGTRIGELYLAFFASPSRKTIKRKEFVFYLVADSPFYDQILLKRQNLITYQSDLNNRQ